LEITCSFCEVSSEGNKSVVQKGEFSICRECLNLLKEILDEFSMGEVSEGKGVCSFCGREQGGERVVFQGKGARICNECLNGIQEEVKRKDKTLYRTTPRVRNQKLTVQDGEVVRARVRKGIQRLSAYSVPHVECRVKLDGNESPFSLPPEILEKVLEEIKSIPINRYPDPGGEVLREKISRVTGFASERIVLGNGSDELIGVLMTTFSGGTGAVLYPVPTFSMYRIMGTTLELELIQVELDEGFDIDVEATLKEMRRKNPDLIFLASPNNPTGNRFSNERVLEVLSSSNGIVVLDEAYCDFSGRTFLPLIEKYENLVVLRSMSKVGFAGIRIGMLFGRGEIVREINKVRLPYNVNSFSQRIAEVILDSAGFVEINAQLIKVERDRVYKALKLVNGVEVYPTDANFILFRVNDADGVFGKLIERGVLIRNFNSPGRLKNCLRVTIGTPEENDAFLTALGEILSSKTI
jgi:histidinol-phosphate aminotransferase